MTEDAPDAPSLWTRPGGDVRHLHEYCRFFPFDPAEGSVRTAATSAVAETVAESRAFASASLSALKAGLGPGPDEEDDAGDTGVAFEYLSGTPRRLLRNTPSVVVLLALLYLVRYGAADAPSTAGGGAGIPPLVAFESILVLTAALVLAVLLGILRFSELTAGVSLLRVGSFYVLLAALLAGTAYSMIAPDAVPVLAGSTAGYLLMLLVGGLLVYDGMLRTEHLFSRLVDRDFTCEAYAAVLRDLRSELGDPEQGYTNPTAVWFAVLVSLLFELVRYLSTVLGGEVYAPADWFGSLLTWATNVLVVLVAFQFLVLIRHLYRMLAGPDGERSSFRYQPFHPDGRGGFGDLGRFATRVNLLLVVGGSYIVYRTVANGEPQPASSWTVLASRSVGPPQAETVDVAIGVVGVGIALAYATAASAWLYYSFWMIHRKMEEGRRRFVAKYLADPEGTAEKYDFDEDKLQLADLREAPVWPVSYAGLLSVVLMNLIPIALSLLGGL